MNIKQKVFSDLISSKELEKLSLQQIKNKIDEARELERKEIQRTIRYWQDRKRQAEMRIKINEKKLKDLK